MLFLIVWREKPAKKQANPSQALQTMEHPQKKKNLDSRETFVCKCSTKLQNLDLHFHVCVRRDADEIG